MGLLKGSNLRFTEAEAIVGADVIPPTEDIPREVTSVVPQAPGLDEADEADPTAEWGGDFELGDDVSDLFATSEDDLAAAEAAVPEWGAPIQEFEKIREQVLFGGQEAADMENNALGEEVMEASATYQAEALELARQELLEANPEGDFDQVAGYVQRRAAAEFMRALVGTTNEVKWTHMQRVERQVVEGAAEIAAGIEANYPPETFGQLMAQREAILSEARLEAERMMMEAMTRNAESEAQAEQVQAQMMLELEKERERILAEMREQAYQEGYNEGKAAGDAQAAQYIGEALTKLNEIAVAFPTAVKQNEDKLVRLALEIARKVIGDEIALQPEVVQRTVETALKRVSDLEQVVVKVNPLDLDLILPKQDTFKALVPDVQSFSIEGSHTIQRGGCIIETNSGSINATINAQLSIIEELFANVRAEYNDAEELG